MAGVVNLGLIQIVFPHTILSIFGTSRTNTGESIIMLTYLSAAVATFASTAIAAIVIQISGNAL